MNSSFVEHPGNGVHQPYTAALMVDDASYSTIAEAPDGSGHTYASILDEFSGGNSSSINDEIAGYERSNRHENPYDDVVGSLENDAVYDQAGLYQRAAEDQEAYQALTVSDMTPEQQKARLAGMTTQMSSHRGKYDALYKTWSRSEWLYVLDQQHKVVKRYVSQKPLQPNPWVSNHKVTSKRYMIKLLEVYEGVNISDPTPTFVEGCTKIAAELGTHLVTFELGPLKRQQRIHEKAQTHGGRFDLIFDYVRATFIIHNVDIYPKLLQMILLRDEFTVVRAKNRLSQSWDSLDSAGYRDYQLLVKTKDGWVFEIQLIPQKMHYLKKSLGHADYVQYRFIIEFCKRARKNNAPKISKVPTKTLAATSLNSNSRRQTAFRCARPSPSGGTCKSVPNTNSRFCTAHTCPHCASSKSSTAAACPKHLDGAPSKPLSVYSHPVHTAAEGTEVGADYHMASATPAGGGDYYDMGGAADYHMATATPIEHVETNA